MALHNDGGLVYYRFDRESAADSGDGDISFMKTKVEVESDEPLLDWVRVTM